MQFCNSGDLKLDAAVEGWLKIDKNPETRKEVLDDIANSRWDKLRGSMLKRQKFGTAGLRGRMGAGYTGMNDVVVLQTAQGLCSYIQKECHQGQLQNGIVIGYDGRYNSKRFAELTARVFVSASIPVHLFSAVCPTPLVSFATILYGVAGGVMVTASHNPKEDNGYKVYWGNGSQITAPHDQHILEEILQYLDIPDSHWVTDGVRSHALVSDCLSEVTERYMQYIADSVGPEQRATNARAAVDTVYSAMHGVGYDYVLKAFESASLKPPISVPEQQEPNPDFPTVVFPNPEEPECLQLSKRLAEQKRARLLLVNDPDADRLAVAEFDRSAKKWKVFSGNEMGALLSWWLLQHATGDDDDRYVITSIVSSKMLRAIVQGRGHFVETLTGFKWMGNTALLLMQQGKNPLFAFEEAIGYMCSPRVPDKDGISAAVHVASLASHLYSSGSSLGEQLQALYREYGYHVCLNGYFICHDQAAIHDIFARIRNYHGPAMYPQKVGSCEIVSVNDFAAGVKIPEESTDNRHLTDVLGTGLDQDYTSGEMVILQCSNGLGLIVRTSGTEPKLKYYTELVCKADTLQEQEQMNAKLKVMVKEFMEELLQPHKHGLIGEIA
ncbi:phosphopentomutase isoform X1 [Cydia pomonella]|uniref:phosphopentomutase isoform X1 n=1 Tax=Cydia pomonella TaxID=82600 RepID=UPI002ADD49AD|nr:phosphopentomutase isoform X1 [Cydia pomonella]